MSTKGQPMIFYTMVPMGEPREQWLSLAQDEDLIEWTKSDANPMLAQDEHDGPRFTSDWRDPYLFTAEENTFVVVTANESVPVYEATNEDLTRWTYRGEFYGKSKYGIVECPSVVKMRDKFVLFYSAMNAGTPYAIGDFDAKSAKFTAEREGFLNHNDAHYAVYPAELPDGRLILYAMLMESKLDYRGKWRQGMTMIRECTLSEDGTLLQRPIREMLELRGITITEPSFTLSDSAKVIDSMNGDSMEIVAQIESAGAKAYGIKVHRSDDGTRYSIIKFADNTLTIGPSSLSYETSGRSIQLRVFIDKGVLEVFTEDGLVAETRLLYPESGDYGVEFFAEGGGISVKSLEAWEMNSIW